MKTYYLPVSLFLFGMLLPLSVFAQETKPAAPVIVPASPKLPPMKLTARFGAPLQDTTIQRFVDSETGVICYLYTPYNVPNSRNENGQLVYNANTIGNISCVAPWKGDAPHQ